MIENINEVNNNSENKCFVCGKETGTKCSNCAKVFYCSVHHQRQDWKRHKLNCHPFEILSNEKFGRYMIACRDIKPGEIVLKEAPLIKGPSQITCPVCVICLQGLFEEDLKENQECEKCGWPVCENCLGKQAKEHEGECQLTRARGSKFHLQHYFDPHPTYQCMIVLRCLLLKDNAPEKWEKLIRLESHSDERRGSIQWCNDREGVAKFIPRFFKCDNKWTEEEILHMSGIVQINGHEVPLTDPPYVAIYDLASLIEHSCAPNLTKTFTGKGEVMFWSPNAIRKGEHLSICYSDALWGTDSRQNHLLQTKMFKCDCIRCHDVTELGTFYSAIKCNGESKNCTGLALPRSLHEWDQDWQCRTCQIMIDQKYVRNLLEKAGRDLSGMEKNDEEACLKYIQYYSKYLPANHHHLCDNEVALTQIIGAGEPTALQGVTEDRLLLKVQLCQKLIKIYSIIAAAESRCLGSLHFELHAALAELGRRAAQEKKNCFRGAIEESLRNAEETVRLLQYEPIVLSEGKICEQAKKNIQSLKMVLASANGSDI